MAPNLDNVSRTNLNGMNVCSNFARVYSCIARGDLPRRINRFIVYFMASNQSVTRVGMAYASTEPDVSIVNVD